MSKTPETFAQFLQRIAPRIASLDRIIKRSGEPLQGNIFYPHLHLGARRQEGTLRIQTVRQRCLKANVVVEIGFNAGHSATVILESNPHVVLYSFDILCHRYGPPCVAQIKKTYGERFHFFQGDSTVQVPACLPPDLKADVIFVDGSHDYADVVLDIQNSARLMHPGSRMLLDDIRMPGVLRAYRDTKGPLNLCTLKHTGEQLVAVPRPARDASGLRVHVFAIAMNGYDRVWKPCLESQRQYCEYHGYEYYVLTDPAMLAKNLGEAQPGPSLHPKWHKISQFDALLGQDRYDLVVLFDADLFVRDYCPPVTSVLTDKAIYVALGFSNRPNSGMVMATPTAKPFFANLLAKRHDPVPKQCFVSAEGENGAFIREYQAHPDLFEIVDRRWNNNTDPNLEDYIRHFCGRFLKPPITANGSVSAAYVRDPAKNKTVQVTPTSTRKPKATKPVRPVRPVKSTRRSTRPVRSAKRRPGLLQKLQRRR